MRRSEDGAILADGVQVGSTQQCCHCNAHFQMVPGSGTVRGFCRRCMKVTCGKHECNDCIPFELKLDLYEKGMIGILR